MLRNHTFLVSVFVALFSLVLSSPVEAKGPHSAKPVVSILGDSYSTFKGYIPDSYACWYDTTPLTDKIQAKKTDVNDVKQTWWWQLINDGGYILGVNDSYSGATISFTGYQGEDYSDRSFITRLPRLGSPDILLIFGATNDSWAGSPLGEFVYSDVAREDLYKFRPAMSRLLSEAVNRFPGTAIYFRINNGLKPEIESSIKAVCDHYKVAYIQLHDIDKLSGHPSRKGMKQIATQVLEAIR